MPEDKQFLITERVPCSRRVNDLQSAAAKVNEIVVDDDWTEVMNEEGSDKKDVVDIDEEKKEEEIK